MTQRTHLDDFLRSRIVGRLECERIQLEVSEELGIAQTVISGLWQRLEDDGNVSRLYSTNRTRVATPNEDQFSLQSDSLRTFIWKAPDTRYHLENIIERLHFGGAGSLVWGIILSSRTDLLVQIEVMTCQIYRSVILELHVRLFRGYRGAEFVFMDDNARPHHANIVNECLLYRRISPVWTGQHSHRT
ncbi:transposable element Tcb1 transposase [Trichonephila clavipes]|nr:transposable element Tcb1 transposase [Trichonephila clavipes]